ncbi:multicopper oxidase family protein [Dyella tabacisoli]|uniref:Bilirubin oxidase n=1 Tax=Dyella tabacisoli TaxID=2282381 RepID=A0A369UGY6_9GAMM|nr:multicopper oxidase domain-containing protein [Dyella tabacisoli]RDD80014.1 Bilirubin oxidase [Dyella tabacisoli]
MVDPQRRRMLSWLSCGAAGLVAVPLLVRYGRQPQAGSGVVAGPSPASASTVPAHPAAHLQHEPGGQALRIPGRDGLMAEQSLSKALHLVARVDSFALFPGEPTALWCYAGEVDGRTLANPVLRAVHGETIDVTLDNRLQEATTIHWHGLSLDEASDGSGLHPVAVGTGARYRFRIRNRAGLYWYHAHPHSRTGMQVQHGLAGVLLVDDEEELALRESLGLRWGERDIPLMIADKQIDQNNAIAYKLDADDWIGNRVLVNWTPEPYLDVVPGWYRFRMANVANARMFRPAFIYDGQPLPMQLIGTDGGLLAQSWPIDDFFLGPAQRVDILLDFSALVPGARVTLCSLEYVAMENDNDDTVTFQPDPMADHPGAEPMGNRLDMMELRVVPPVQPIQKTHVPQQLARLDPTPDTTGWPVRHFRLRTDQDGRWFINDWNFHINGHESVFAVKRGTREVWEIRNYMTSMPHPIHLHGFQFRVVSRSISPPDIRARMVTAEGLGPQDLGVADTVVIWPGEIVRIAIDFAQPFTGTQRYMFHCHNLEHEDKGMMVMFAVTD